MSDFVPVARVEEIAPGEVKVFFVGDVPVAIARVGERFCAFQDACTHDDGPLAEGELEGDVIVCPRHGARFNVCTGKVLAFPAVVPLTTYEVRLAGDEILVKIE